MNLEKLKDAGIDYMEGTSRFGGKTSLYEKYLVKFFKSATMEKIIEQLDENNIIDAFRFAHDLKGNSGNLSLNNLYRAAGELVEILRSGTAEKPDYENMLATVEKLYNKAHDAFMEEIYNGTND